MQHVEKRSVIVAELLLVFAALFALNLLLGQRFPVPDPDWQVAWSHNLGTLIGATVMPPFIAVFGWPVGFWFWRLGRAQHDRIGRVGADFFAVMSWLLAILVIFALFHSWFLA